jgi:tetratricopeptide (TPR) repeat protein
MMIAECHIKMGNPEKALKSLRQALRRTRQPGVVHKRLGDLLTTLGKYIEAVEEYRMALLHQPEFREKQPELVSLIDKAQTLGENQEPLAKQIQAMLAPISAAKRAAMKGQAQEMDGNLSAPDECRKPVVQRFGRLRRQ